MLWSKKKKVHEPFKSDDWDLVRVTNFATDTYRALLIVPDNCYWELLILSFTHKGLWQPSPWMWIYLESGDVVIWSICFPETIQSANSIRVTVSPGLGFLKEDTNHQIKTGNLPFPCYLLPGDKLYMTQTPYDSSLTWETPVASVREWRIY